MRTCTAGGARVLLGIALVGPRSLRHHPPVAGRQGEPAHVRPSRRPLGAVPPTVDRPTSRRPDSNRPPQQVQAVGLHPGRSFLQ